MADFDPADFSTSLAAMADAGDIEQLRGCIMRGMGLLGIDRVYFVAPLTADPRVGRVITNIGLPAAWERQYRRRLFRCDPLPGLSQAIHGPFCWPDDIAGMQVDRRQARYLRHAARHGLDRGIGLACYGPAGRAGFLSCAWPSGARPDGRTMAGVYLIGQYSFQKYCTLVPQSPGTARLSDRELEVLSWMCMGKSNPVIAQLLNISRSSVDVYVRRLFAKLGVTDRTAACVRAYSLGLTVSGDYRRHMDEIRGRADMTQVPD